MTELNYQQAAAFLKSDACRDVFILTHQSPDGDCIGTGFALKYVLEGLGKRARVICPDEIPARYGFCTTPQTEDFTPACIIAVDLADLQLLGALRETYEGRVDLCIDHHVSNVRYADRLCLNGNAAAACEVLYEVITAGELPLHEKIATCLYTGIATDTGCFKYENAGPRTHEIVAALKRSFQIPYAWINRQMFDIKSLARLKMEKQITELMEFYLDGKCTVICITQEILSSMGVSAQELEGIAGLPLQVEGVEVGITIKEKEDGLYKLSMRSTGDADVSRICVGLGGGGHAKAAGCAIHGTLSEVRTTAVNAVEKELEARA